MAGKLPVSAPPGTWSQMPTTLLSVLVASPPLELAMTYLQGAMGVRYEGTAVTGPTWVGLVDVPYWCLNVS